MKNIVITIGREYGSGGKYIGDECAKRLGINCYDKEILDIVYEKSNYSYSRLNEYDERRKNTLMHLFASLNYTSNEVLLSTGEYDRLVNETLVELAKSESCIIVGRNANNVLKNMDNVINIFIYANDIDFKIKRKMEIENISYDEAVKRMRDVDKKRKHYYESLNKGHTWGVKNDYDILIDSGVLGIEGTIKMICDIYNNFRNSSN